MDISRQSAGAIESCSSLFLPETILEDKQRNSYFFRGNHGKTDINRILSGQESDPTGEYNPKKPRCGPRQRSLEAPKRRRIEQHPNGNREARMPRIQTLQGGRSNGRRLCMTFFFTSFRAWTTLQSVGSQIPVGYFEVTDPNGDSCTEKAKTSPTGIRDEDLQLRSRAMKAPKQKLDGYHGLMLPPIGDSAFRSCLHCFTTIGDCSLIQDRQADPPCQTCFDDHEECIPISDIEAIATPCEACTAKCTICHNLKMKGDQPFSCPKCREDEEPHCVVRKLSHTDVLSDSLVNSANPIIGARAQQEHNTRRQHVQRGDSYNIRLLTTNFCHPIQFNQPSARAKDTCFWCVRPVNGVKGLLKVEVTVKEFDDSRLGYEEIEGGHSPWQPATRMCQGCTSQRLRILTCQAHNLVPFVSSINRDERSIRIAKHGAYRGHTMEAGWWCVLCDHVASFRCLPKSSVSEIVKSCGLSLCWNCTVHYLNSGLDLDKAVRDRFMIPDRIIRTDQGVIVNHEKTIIRADAGFLSKNGELWRQVMLPRLESAIHSVQTSDHTRNP